MNKEFSIVFFVSLILTSTILPSLFPEYYVYIQIAPILLISLGVYFSVFFTIKLFTNTHKHYPDIRITITDIVIFLLAIYTVTRYLLSVNTRLSPDKLIIYAAVFVSYVFVRKHVGKNDSKTIRYILNTIIVFGSVQCLYALLQWLSIIPNLFDCYKFGGTYGNPGDLANVLCISFALSLNTLKHKNNKAIKWVLVNIVLLHLVIIISSEARTAWIATFIIGIYTFKNNLIDYYLKIRNRISKLVSAFIVIAIMAVGIFVLIKLYTFKHDSSSGRIFIWKQCTELILEKPLFGHGYDSFFTAYLTKQAEYFMQNPDDVKNGMLADEINYAYNDFIQYGVEYGLLGMCMLLLIFLFVFIQKSAPNNKQHNRIISIRSAVVGIIACMLFSYALQNASILIIGAILVAIHATYSTKHLIQAQFIAKYTRFFAIILIAASLVISIIAIKHFNYCYTWKQEHDNYVSGKNKSIDNYKQLYDKLKYNKAFLYGYGATLYRLGKYRECINHFNHYYQYCLSIDMLMKLADSYTRLNNFVKAEKYFKQASYSKPHLFVPKYRLFRLYISTNQHTKAKEVATTIKNMDVKVFSETVREIKSKANQYLIENN